MSLLRIKDVAIVNATTPSSKIGALVNYLPMQNVSETGQFNAPVHEKSKLPSGLNNFSEGDFLLAKISPCFENGKSALIDRLETGYGMGSSELMPIKPFDINPRYLRYLLGSPEFLNAGANEFKGATGHQRISPRFVSEYVFDAGVDQERVVEVLVEKTQNIDSQIALLKTKLTRLGEYKTALIHNAVTKGLDANGCRILDGTPASEMQWKPSGVEWIGDIPDNWDVLTLKECVSRIQTGGTPTSGDDSYYVEDGEQWACIGDMSGKMYFNDSKKKLSSSAIKEKGLKKNDVGDVMYAIYASVGEACIVKTPTTTNQAILSITPSDILSTELLYFYLVAAKCSLNFYAKESTQLNLNQETVKGFKIPMSVKGESDAISDYLVRVCQKIDGLSGSLNKKILKLVEYKNSLINEMVGGA